jgi:D-galactose 1-dehydrogenase
MPGKVKIAIVGLGKIARDQHVPTLAASDAFELVAVASPRSRLAGVRCYETIEALLAAEPDVEAVALCTTPQARYDVACRALARRCHVLLEKPPGATVSEVVALADGARDQGVALFASWHSRHAPAVEPARAWLADKMPTRASITWREDVRVWHPGQRWIWQAGGLGVFDPGINALSILTRIMPGGGIILREAELSYPANCETPIAARLLLSDSRGTPIRVDLDFLQTGPPCWDIVVETPAGRLVLSKGGTLMRVDEREVGVPATREYASLYAEFAKLVATRSVAVDLRPFQLVADALLCGRPVRVAPFEG